MKRQYPMPWPYNSRQRKMNLWQDKKEILKKLCGVQFSKFGILFKFIYSVLILFEQTDKNTKFLESGETLSLRMPWS